MAGLVFVLTELLCLRVTGVSWWSVVVVPMSAALLLVSVQLVRANRRVGRLLHQRDDLGRQLEHRVDELFTIRELGQLLSGSFQAERLVEQLVQYVGRFISARGVMLVLVEEGDWIRVAAAEGSLVPQIGRRLPRSEPSLVSTALAHGRLEVEAQPAAPGVRVLDAVMARSAAVVPLRAHDETIGALAVVDRRTGSFTTEDRWLLSTVASSASMVLANSRLFFRVEHGRLQWEAAFDALREGMAVLNADGIIQRTNRALGTMTGSAPGALHGEAFAPLLFADPGPAQDYMRQVQVSGAATAPGPLAGRHGGLLRLTLAPLGGAGGSGAMVALVEDVTAQRALEAQLIQSEKLAAIGQLVSGVAHELNNPLTSISGLAELLLEQEPLPDSPRQHLRIIHDQAERAGRIVRNLLTFARSETEQKTLVDLNEVVGRTSSLVAYDARLREIALQHDLSGEALPVQGDPHELQQVLLNLLTNAIQALAGLPADRVRRIVVSTAGGTDGAVLAVTDSGDGVAEEARPKLFTPFFTTKPAGQGTGLGLSLSYGIAQAHGGSLTYSQAPGGGACFTLTLPLVDTSGAPAPTPAAGPHHILVATVDPVLQRLVRALFSPVGHVVHTALDAGQLHALLEQEDFDMVVVDGDLPAGDEPSMVALLLQARPAWVGRTVVIGSAVGGAGPARWLPKPLDVRLLRQLAAQILDGSAPARPL